MANPSICRLWRACTLLRGLTFEGYFAPYCRLRLLLNAAKTEWIWFGSRVNLARIPERFRSLQVRGSDIECADVVRDLGVYLDSELSMKNHVSKIASACFYHIRRLRQIRHYVSREVLKQLVTSLVLSRLDYCNSVLVGLPASTLMPLQRAQNAAARLVLGLDRRSHTTAALQDLHWLPVRHRITFKIASLMHQVLHQRCLTYLSDVVEFNSVGTQRRLRSTTTGAAVVRRTRTQFWRRGPSLFVVQTFGTLFPHAAIRTTDYYPAFRRSLKHTYFILLLTSSYSCFYVRQLCWST